MIFLGLKKCSDLFMSYSFLFPAFPKYQFETGEHGKKKKKTLRFSKIYFISAFDSFFFWVSSKCKNMIIFFTFSLVFTMDKTSDRKAQSPKHVRN